MMVSMYNVYNALCPGAMGNIMKNKTVHQVFKKCPGEYTPGKYGYDQGKSKILFCKTVIKQKENYRKVHTPYNQWVRFCKHFKILISLVDIQFKRNF